MGMADIGGSPMKHTLSASALKKARARIDHAHKQTKSRLSNLSKAITEKDDQQQRSDLSWLITDPTALLSNAFKANAAIHPTKRVPFETCLNLSESADLTHPIPELVEMYAKPKKNGFRVIHEFGIMHRTIQFGVRQAASRYFVPRSFQFSHVGVPKAIDRVKKAVFDGHVHVAEIDIKKFYSSFCEEKLLKEFTLPNAVELPSEVVKNAVFTRHYEAEWKKGGLHNVPSLFLQGLYQEAHSGISTGSGCSPIVAMIAVSKLAWPSPAEVSLVNYYDNFLVLASSSALLKDAIGQLSDAIEQLPGGHFESKEVFRANAADGFDFLGHNLKLEGSSTLIEPCYSNFNDFCGTCDRFDQQIGRQLLGPKKRNAAVGIRLALEQMAYINGFLSAFDRCDEDAMRFYEWQIEDVVATLRRASIKMDAVITDAKTYGSTYQPEHFFYL